MPKKRADGEGSMRRRPNGLWEWQVMVGHYEDGRRKMKSFYGRTQKEVREKALKYLEELKKAPKIGTEMSFSSWADIWYKGMAGRVAESTYEGYRYTLVHVKGYFGDRALSSIKAMDVEKFLAQMALDGQSKSYLTKMRGMLFQIMRKAEANEFIAKNPVSLADSVKIADDRTKKDAFTAEEVKIMMQRLPRDRLGLSIRLMLGTGMRTQEVLGLEPKHIAPDGSRIQIRQAVTMVKGTPKIGPPKTKSSYREVPVPLALQEAARELRRTSEKFIWHGEKVALTNPSVFRNQFKRELEKVGDVRLLSPHCCRHTYVSQLQAMGVELETIKALSGHADVDMTEHYLHVQQEVKQDAVGRLNKLLLEESELLTKPEEKKRKKKPPKA